MSRDLIVRLSDEEDLVLAEVKARGGFPDEQSVVKLGIYKVSAHFDIPMSDECLNTDYTEAMRPLLDAIRRKRDGEPGERPLLEQLDDVNAARSAE